MLFKWSDFITLNTNVEIFKYKKNKNKLFVHLQHKWAWPKQLAQIFSATVGIIS